MSFITFMDIEEMPYSMSRSMTEIEIFLNK